MRVNLNLLPEEKKEEIEKKKKMRIIFYQGFLLFSAAVVLAVILININLILQIKLKAIENMDSKQNDDSANIEMKEYEAKFKEVNNRVAALKQIINSKICWSKLFTRLSQLTPDEISLLNLATKDNAVMLSGKAQNRDDLIKFKDNLSSESCFTDVNVPLSNLVVKDNLDFQLDFKIKIECLKDE